MPKNRPIWDLPTDQQPPGPGGPPWQPPPGGPYQQPRQRRRHWVRWTVLSAVAILAPVIRIGTAFGSRSNPRWAPSSFPAAAAPPPPVTQAVEPPPSAQLANHVVFVITGQVPAGELGEVDLTYGSHSDSPDMTLPSLNGTVRDVVPCDGLAQYYALDVTFTPAGQVSRKIMVKGPYFNVPLIVSRASASGGNKRWPLLRSGSSEQLNRHVLAKRRVNGMRRCSQRVPVTMSSVRYCLVLHHERSSSGVQSNMAVGRETSW
jgi:hypothetical protein